MVDVERRLLRTGRDGDVRGRGEKAGPHRPFQKVCPPAEKCGSEGKKQGMSNFHLLLLAQNECGEVVARVLTSSENHAETEALLSQRILPRVAEKPETEYVLVSDNASSRAGLDGCSPSQAPVA
ncbi:hypothetical protein FI667_g15386, partial [Globisporangium splendens]